MLSLNIIFAFPMSTSYQLKGFEFGSGGDATMNSATYKMEGLAGEVGSERQNSTSYSANSGLQFVQMANTPTISITNDSNWYDKLKIVIGTSSNPSDTTYAIAISIDNFSTTNYVQSDGTIGSTLGPEDFLSYSSWGGASGSLIIGLESGTTYYVKSKARQGNFTEGPFGPITNASTVNPTISIDIDISPIDTETTGPYSIDIGDVSVGSVTTTNDKIWVDFETNAYGGGAVYVKGQNTGLTSSTALFTIPSSTTDLATANTGYGMKGISATQSSGGPFSIISPYNGSSENVGVLDPTYRELFRTAAPLVAGRGSSVLKAKVNSDVPAADDYSDILTVIASASF
ncbi:MAG: hypothetical protein U0525_01435 [Patescibacteria group bacterium]